MISVTFETATIADAVKKAARIAPGKGAAFDRAAGVLFEVAKETVILKATNLEVFYMEWVDFTSCDAGVDPTLWRLPSAMLAGILAGLPIGTGKTVTIEAEDEKKVLLTSGRTKATLNLIDPSYFPEWYAFDPDKLTPVSGFGARLTQAEWAASGGTEPPWNGVYLDGVNVVATDRFKLARVPLDAPMLDHPVTIPAGILGPVIKQMGDTGVGVEGEQLLLMPDEHTQIRTVIYGVPYPNLERIMDRTRPNIVMFRKEDMIAMVSRMLNLVKSDRYPTLRVFIGDEEIAGSMSDDQIGSIEDAIEVPGQCTHESVEIKFTPKNLLDALNAGPNDMISMGYDPAAQNKPVFIDGGSGYEAWVMPRRGTDKQE